MEDSNKRAVVSRFGTQLTIDDVRDSDEEASITCQAANTAGSSERITVGLIVECEYTFQLYEHGMDDFIY